MARKLEQPDWIADVVFPSLVILTEAFWLYPWLIWLGHLPLFAEVRPPVSLLSVIFTLGFSLAGARFFLKQHWPMWQVRSAIIGCGVIFVLLIFRIEYGTGYPLFGGGWFAHIRGLLATTFSNTRVVSVAVPTGLFLWWRGILLERRTSTFEGIFRLFNIGIIGLIGLIIVWFITFPGGRYQSAMGAIRLYAVCFFCFGLASLAVGNLRLKRVTGQESRASTWRSLAIILAVIALIALLGFLAAELFSPGLFQTIGTGFSSVWAVVARGMYYVVYPFVYLAALFFELLKRLVALIVKSGSFEMEGAGEPLREGIEQTAREIPGLVTTILEVLAAAALITLAVFILAKAIKRLKGGHADDVEEVHESVLSLGELRNDLGQLLRKLGRMFERQRKSSAPYDDAVDTLSIREIYKRLLWEGKLAGIERRRCETPGEYAGRLKPELLPEGAEPLYEITECYARVRYGDKEMSGDQMLGARRIWVALRSAIRRIGKPAE